MHEEVIIKAAEIIPSGFTSPYLLGAAGAFAAGAVALDMYKARNETRVINDLATPLADPEQAEFAKVDNRRTRTRSRAAYYAGVAFISACVIQVAAPFTTHTREKGTASIVINADLTANSPDMQDGAAHDTRLDASVRGSLEAAATDNVPTSFVLSGISGQLVASTPSTGVKQIQKKINQSLGSTFRDGEDLSGAVGQALSAQGTEPNTIVVVASALTPKDTSGIAAAEATLQPGHAPYKLYGVVVGNTQGSQQIGAETLTSPVDLSSFQEFLGKANVQSAASVAQVEQDIKKVIGKDQTVEHKHPLDVIDLDLGSVLGGILASMALFRRLAGIRTLRKAAINEGGN
jgi:hypothetical protein